MLQPYRDVVRAVPGSAAFLAAGTLARLPMSTLGIGIVLAVAGLTGSYALAGQVSGVLVLVQAACSPQLARLVDRYGQARVMRPAVAGTLVGLAVVMATVLLGLPTFLLHVGAALTGAGIGSFSSLSRARWSSALRGRPAELHVAYSLESVLDEVVFVIGPVLATVLATSVHPLAGLVVGTVALAVGGSWFLSLRGTEPVAGGSPRGRQATGRTHHGGSAIRVPAVGIVSATFVAMGMIFGATDVATVAFAEELDQSWAAGIVLAVFALGSLVSGLLYGTRQWRRPVEVRFATGMVGLGVGVVLFALVGSLPALAVVMFVVGGTISPSLITGNQLVEGAVPDHQVTEGLAWLGTALGVGVALGSWLAGLRIDAAGAHAGFVVVVVAGVAAVALTVLALPALRRR